MWLLCTGTFCLKHAVAIICRFRGSSGLGGSGGSWRISSLFCYQLFVQQQAKTLRPFPNLQALFLEAYLGSDWCVFHKTTKWLERNEPCQKKIKQQRSKHRHDLWKVTHSASCVLPVLPNKRKHWNLKLYGFRWGIISGVYMKIHFLCQPWTTLVLPGSSASLIVFIHAVFFMDAQLYRTISIW